jgi:hypothetical protein
MIEFNAKDHTYKMDGVQLPSVSQILQEAGKVPKFPNNGAAQRGTDIHDLCKLFDRGVILAGFGEDKYQGYLLAWAQFLIDAKFLSFDHIEEPIGSSIYGFAGTPDRVGIGPAGECVIDIKSGQKASFHALQLNAYRILAEENYGIKVLHLWAVYLRENGRYSVEPYVISDEFLDILRRRSK